MTCEKCGGEHYDDAGRLDWGELPAALAHELRVALDPTLEAFQQLLREASPVRVVPSARCSTTRVVFDGNSNDPKMLVPAEQARIRVTIIATYQNMMSGIASGPQIVDVFTRGEDTQPMSQTAGFPLVTGGSSATANSNGISLPAPLMLATKAGLWVGLRNPAGSAVGSIIVAALSEYADV